MNSRGGIHGVLRFDHVRRALDRGGADGVKRALDCLLSRSLEEVPRDTGALARSGRVEMTDEHQGRVIYDTEYAISQHERTDFAHPGGGKAKYLEDPAEDSAVRAEMLTALGNELRRALDA